MNVFDLCLILICLQNKVGMEDSLVDGNGFPRNDIDVYQVRHARHRIICKLLTICCFHSIMAHPL